MLEMDQPCDDMLFGSVIQKDSIHSSLSNNGEEQSCPGTADTPVLSLPDQAGGPPSSESIHNEHTSASSVHGIIKRPPGRRDRDWVIARIEDIFERQLDSISANDHHLSVAIKSRARPRQAQLAGNSGQFAAEIFRTFQFPGKTEQDAWRFTVILRILELVHEALSNEVTITKRDIYYRDPALFSKQAVVDRYVDDIACTLGISRYLLNVTATAKGLVAGAFAIIRADGTRLDGWSDREGLLVSALAEGEALNLSNVNWVLVVEKEATFRSLVSSDFWFTLVSHGILVTAKGYPDIATRSFLRSLTTPNSYNNVKHCQLYGLMDFDPDGLDILSTYKYGSATLAHENERLALPSLRGIGVSSSHISKEDNLHQSQGLLKLSARDRRKATLMLEREPFIENGSEPEWRKEIQAMLMLNVKAEIQLLEARAGGLTGWLKDESVLI